MVLITTPSLNLGRYNSYPGPWSKLWLKQIPLASNQRLPGVHPRWTWRCSGTLKPEESLWRWSRWRGPWILRRSGRRTRWCPRWRYGRPRRPRCCAYPRRPSSSPKLIYVEPEIYLKIIIHLINYFNYWNSFKNHNELLYSNNMWHPREGVKTMSLTLSDGNNPNVFKMTFMIYFLNEISPTSKSYIFVKEKWKKVMSHKACG